jgi:hypothetical protein
MGRRLTFGKRRCLTLPSATQFFHFLSQLLDHPLLLDQQSDQFRTAQRFRIRHANIVHHFCFEGQEKVRPPRTRVRQERLVR